MNLPELLQWVKFGKKTGMIVFERKGIVKKVFVQDGLVISASSNDPKEYLGQILIFFGYISEDQLKEAFEMQAASKKLLGRILVESYGIKENEILKGLRVKIEETVYDLFLWDEGKFIYTDGIPEISRHDRLDSPITIDHVIFEGARRVDEWRQFKKEFPHDDVVFKKVETPQDLGDLKGDWFVQKILSSIDGKKSNRRVLLETRAPEYRAVEAIAKLYWGKHIEPIKIFAEAIADERPDSESLLKQAIDFFKEKEFHKAYDLIEKFVLEDPTHQEGQTLFSVVRESYLKQLYDKCPPDGIPEIAVDFSVLNEKIFTSLEGFLASRINGHWDVKSLMMISPVPDVESLRILKRFLDEGLIRVKAPN